jgi:hypothetical protein
VRIKFSVVFEELLMPITHRHPNQNAEEMGARLKEPSSLTVLIMTTGVPKYRIEVSHLQMHTFFVEPAKFQIFYRQRNLILAKLNPDLGKNGCPLISRNQFRNGQI